MMRIGGIQMACQEDKEQNMRRALELAEAALDRGVQVLCFQECFHIPWVPSVCDIQRFSYAEPIPGETTERVGELAKRYGAVIICPLFERQTPGSYYNAAAVIGPDGQLLGRYRKNHIPQMPNYEEKFYFRPGDSGFPVFRAGLATLGVQICWDNFFPEGSRILALKGAEIIFAPTATSAPAAIPKWERVMAANAISNGVFLFRINRVGQEGNLHFYGRSFCLDPFGEFLVEPSGGGDGAILAEIHLEMIREARESWAFFRDRRPEIYGELLEA
ncbi:MAG: nitrilase-related carbon-nitrogen hydrolase [candidate division NC10 bacterium]|nr:nitrilase-related carbon-nitrogen hydrolase [candidate division NC10 bacterium]